MSNLFNQKVLEDQMEDYEIEDFENKFSIIEGWQRNLEGIKGVNELGLQGAFLQGVFGNILNYINLTAADENGDYSLKSEPSTEVDATNPDGSLGVFNTAEDFDDDTLAVIELKGPKVSLDKKQKRDGKDYGTPVEQAFRYATKHDGCKWVIVSNMIEIRLYKYERGQGYYHEFFIDQLDDLDKFKEFNYILSRDNLINPENPDKSKTFELSKRTVKHEKDISVEFYNIYKDIRVDLFEHLKENNPDIDEELLLEKAQKFLDRIIFIAFCEDKRLLPNDLLQETIKDGKKSFSPVWEHIKGVFQSIDQGNSAHDINRYNGGLFEHDDDLDNLIINNDFFENIYEISGYNFDSELDVNILGHIFEQSISDLEKIKLEIQEGDFEEEESKRHKDGIYYTPQYITKYIVENAIGGYLENIKKELGYYDLPNIEDAGSESWKTRYTQQHLEFYEKYEERLKNIKILDPAVGSGAFLNQAFDYLLEEHKWLNKQRDLLQGGQTSIFALDAVQRDILKNNIFGVDLNEESVEITKLSLWLKTANKSKPLTNLDDNIKCGNSLIDDSELIGEKAFKWEEEFGDIMEDGGFDVIVGNPPYHGINQEEQDSLYADYNFSNDLYHLFFELSLEKLLNKENYTFGFITPRFFLFNQNTDVLRKHILENYNLNKIVETVPFEDATTENVITIINSEEEIDYIDIEKDEDNRFIKFNEMEKQYLSKQEENGYTINTALMKEDIEVIKTLEEDTVLLGDISDSKRGMEIGKKTIRGYDDGFPTFLGEDVDRFVVDFQNTYVDEDNKEYKRLEEFFDNELIYLRRVADSLIATETRRPAAFIKNLYGINVNSEDYDQQYILALLNSKLLTYYYKKKFSTKKEEVFPEIQKYLYEKLPIPKEQKKKNEIIELVNSINRKKREKLGQEKTSFNDIVERYASQDKKVSVEEIFNSSNYQDELYTNRASKIRDYSVNINTNVITIYLDKSGSGKYEVIKFEEDNRYKRQFIKNYFENFSDEKLKEIENSCDGNITDKTFNIEVPNYNNGKSIRRIMTVWNDIQDEISELDEQIKQAEKELNQTVYEVYGLSDEEIEIIENTY